MSPRERRIRGIAIPVVLVVIMIVLILGIAISTVSLHNSRLVNKNRYNQRALYAAEAGLSKAILKIQASPSWNGYEDPQTKQTPTYSSVAVNTSSSDSDSFNVRVYNNFTPATPVALVAENGISVPVGSCFILSEGVAYGSKATKKVGCVMTCQSLFNYGLFGDSRADLGNVNLYAYDSSSSTSMPVTKLDDQGNAGSNGKGWTSGSVITTKGNPNIDGGVYLASTVPLNSTTVNVTLSKIDTGAHSTAPQPMPTITPPTLPSGTVPSGNNKVLQPGYDYSSISISSRDTVTLNGGGVYIFDDVSITANTNIVAKNVSLSNPIIIYLNGDVNARGNSGLAFEHVDAAGNPIGGAPVAGKVQIYGTQNCKSVFFRGNPQGAFAFYGPNTAVSIRGNVDIYGAFVAGSIDERGHAADVYYDVSLKDLTMDSSPPSPGAWMRF